MWLVIERLHAAPPPPKHNSILEHLLDVYHTCCTFAQKKTPVCTFSPYSCLSGLLCTRQRKIKHIHLMANRRLNMREPA